MLRPALTLIELVLTMAILAIVATSSVLFTSRLASKNQVDGSARKLADVLRLARLSSRESKPLNLAGLPTPAAWGVVSQADTYTLVGKTPSSPDPVLLSSHRLDPGTHFPLGNFTIWFQPGTGNLQSGPTQIVIRHLAQPQTQKVIHLSPTGIIEII